MWDKKNNNTYTVFKVLKYKSIGKYNNYLGN